MSYVKRACVYILVYMEMVIFIIWIALTPWILLYGAYEGPKVFWFWLGGFFLTVRWLIAMLKSTHSTPRAEARDMLRVDTERRILLRTKVGSLAPSNVSKELTIDTTGGWLLAWVSVLCVASLLGIHPLDSLVGGGYRHQGVLFFFTLFLVFETLRMLPGKHKKVLAGMIGAGVVFESSIILLQKMMALSDRPLGSFGEPNAVAGFLAVGLFWVFRMPRISKRLRIIFGIMVFLAVVATESRTGVVAAVIVCAASGIQTVAGRRREWMRRVLFISGLLATGIACGIFMAWVVAKRPVSNYESRTLFWRLGVQAVRARPVLGYGAESEDVIYEKEFKTINVRLIDLTVDRSHNVFLDVALWSGLVGLIVFVGWFVNIGRGFIISGDRGRMFVLAAWIVFACFQPLGVVHWILLVLLASFI
jgi:hypothetical protein